ncbi:DUF7550 family protein [Halosimplex pelagicum]|uniref:Uncharacterized protein n=1 Tax=Halosimplex pelagicum TaxID=869886 RepID=A0A7D5PA26_9EURY|nr:hypothetical protein [Halosimplex pelagicum]QLH83101.1 hypothetical protein HZS54_16365 [Halosimplex pelagicum]
MVDEHEDAAHGHEDRPDYDPANKDLPAGEPPLRSTAPQSEYVGRDVGVGIAVMLVGVALTFVLPIALV